MTGQSVPKYGIGLMCKPPRPGTSKTRLASDIGADRAAELSRAFLADAIATLRAAATLVSAQPFCFFKPMDAEDEIREFAGDGVSVLLQDGNNLGASMLSALRRILQECPHGAALMGADAPTLPSGLVSSAFGELARPKVDAVFGPSDDGGYYLVAIKGEPARPLFEEINWSTPSVMQETRERAAKHGLQIAELETWYDVDDISGLNRLIAELSTSNRRRPLGPASATRAVLGLAEAGNH